MSEKIKLIFACIALGLSVLNYICWGTYLIVKKFNHPKPVDPKKLKVHKEVDLKYHAVIKDAKGAILYTKDFKSKTLARKAIKKALKELEAAGKIPATYKLSKKQLKGLKTVITDRPLIIGGYNL